MDIIFISDVADNDVISDVIDDAITTNLDPNVGVAMWGWPEWWAGPRGYMT